MNAGTGYRSGFCAHGRHDRCRGDYGTAVCVCDCGHRPAEPEPSGPRILSLFSGYGGLDLAVREVLGGEVIGHAEIEPAACRILEHRFPGVPNVGDVSTVDWAVVGPVDVICGGFPCQDVSAAGKRAGLRPDTRSGLWAQFAYSISQLRPGLVVVENVRGLLSADAHSDVEPCPWCVGDGDAVLLRALGAVLGDLASLGYDASWRGIRAADVGAPHGRFRVFVTAWPADSTSLPGRIGHGDDLRPRRGVVHGQSDAGRGTAAHADRLGHERGRRARDGRPGPADVGRHAPDANGERLARAEPPAAGRQSPADHTGGCGQSAADPDLAGSQGGEPAPGRELSARCPTPNTPGDGRHEGRPEPARLVGGPHAPVGGHALAHPHGDALREQPVAVAGCGGAAVAGHAGTDAAAHADSGGLGADLAHLRARQPDPAWGAYEPAVRRWERCLGRPAPSPTEPGAKGQPRLSPRFVEWMMGLPAGWVCGVPGLTRNEQLKALGNGVVPQQAAEALRMLLADVAAPPVLMETEGVA